MKDRYKQPLQLLFERDRTMKQDNLTLLRHQLDARISANQPNTERHYSSSNDSFLNKLAVTPPVLPARQVPESLFSQLISKSKMALGVFAALFASNAPAQDFTFTTDNYRVNEGESARTIGVRCEMPTGSNEAPVSVNYNSSDGTAQADSDYTAVEGILTWPAATVDATGNTFGGCDGSTRDFEIQILEDAEIEDEETVNLALSNGQESLLSIIDHPVQFSQSNYPVSEASNTATIELICNSDVSNNAPISVTYSTNDGTAIADSDYTATNGTLTWNASACTGTTQSFEVPIIQDSELEEDETVNLTLNNGKTAQLSILDSSLPPVASFTVTPNTGVEPFTVSVDASASSDPDSTNLSYSWSTSDGKTASGITASLTFDTPGTHSITLTVTDETGLTDTAQQNVTVIALADIIDFSQATYQVNETGNSATIDVRCDSDVPITTPISVTYSSSDGTATAGNDYTAVQGTLTWEANLCNGTLQNFQLPILADTSVEGEETVNLTLSNGQTALISILDENAPQASFDITPYSPMTVSLDASAFIDLAELQGQSVEYLWSSYPGGQTASGETTTMAFDSPGEYVITLNIVNDSGQVIATKEESLTVAALGTTPQPIELSSPFQVTPNSPLGILLDATKSLDPEGTALNYAWSSSDGQTTSGQTTTMNFNAPGIYTITLTVTDESGQTASMQQNITVSELPVENQPPTALLTVSPTEGNVPLTVELDASESFDVEGPIAQFDWYIDDQLSTLGNVAQTNYTFTVEGFHTIEVVVTDEQGLTGSFQQDVTVEAVPEVTTTEPIANFNLTPTSGRAPLVVKVDASNSIGTGLKYAWSTSEREESSGDTTTLTFNTPGSHLINLTVIDENESTATLQKTVSINQPPIASFTMTPESGQAPITITLDAQNSFDYDGTITDHIWSSSDGQRSIGEQARLFFREPGYYLISLTVVDNLGDTGISEKILEVSNQPPVASFTVTPCDEKEDTILHLSADNMTIRCDEEEANNMMIRCNETESVATVIEADNEAEADNADISIEADNETEADNGDTSIEVNNEIVADNETETDNGDTTIEANDSSITEPLLDDIQFVDCRWSKNTDEEQTQIGTEASFTFNTTGEHQLTLEAINAEGVATKCLTETITVCQQPSELIELPTDEPLIADMTVIPLSGKAPLAITLDGTLSEGNITDYQWEVSFESDGETEVVEEEDNQAIDNIEAEESESAATVEEDNDATETVETEKEEIPDSGEENAQEDDNKIIVFGDIATRELSKPGNYTITLTVTDSNGQQKTTARQTITVFENPPVAEFRVSPNSGPSPLKIQFDADKSSDPDGNITDYQWQIVQKEIELNSTAVSETVGLEEQFKGKTVTFSLDKEGIYTITLTVTDNDGLKTTTEDFVTVRDGIEKNEIFELAFEGLKESYRIGERIVVDLREDLVSSRFDRVDLWVWLANSDESSGLLFKPELAISGWDSEPQAFRKDLETAQERYRILELQVSEDWTLGSGELTLYALYVAEGTNPFEDEQEVWRSELVKAKTYISISGK
jgi:PKD repeat protein